MFRPTFWQVTVDRAIRTAAQTAVVLLGAGQVDVLTSLTATIRRTDQGQGQGDWLDDLNRENP